MSASNAPARIPQAEMGIRPAQPIQLARIRGIQDRPEARHQIMHATKKRFLSMVL